MINTDGEEILDFIQGKIIDSLYENISFFRDLELLNLNSLSFESPDLLLVSENIIYGIEHFQVTSFKTSRSGSSLKKVNNERIRESNYEKINENLKIENKSSIEIGDIPESKYEFLVENIKTFFDKHYQKIQSYRQNINSKFPNKIIKIIFFIEYDTVLPFGFTQTISNKLISPFYPHKDINLLNYFSDKTLLEGIIFNYSIGVERKNLFLPILDEYKSDDKILFDTKGGIVESMKLNISHVGVKILKD